MAALFVTAFLVQLLANVGVLLFLLLRNRESGSRKSSEIDATALISVASGVEITAENVMSAADDHSSKVELAMKNLSALSQAGGDVSGAVSKAVADLLGANQQLKSQLTEAKEQLQLQHEQMDQLRNESLTDPLTKLANRRAIETELVRTHASWTRQQRNYALVMVDIDYFKRINDQNGHDVGDEALRSFATYVRRFLRTTDFVGRYGGEEFLILMPGVSLDQALVAAERLRSSVEGKAWSFHGHEIPLTTSLGVAAPAPSEEIASVVKRADGALYSAKQAGRNRCYYSDQVRFFPAKNLLDSKQRPAVPEISPFLKSKIEQRKHSRRPFRCLQRAAQYDGEKWPSRDEFFEVECVDISAGGLSFLAKRRVEKNRLLVTLGKPDENVFVYTEVMYARAVIFHGSPMFRVGCRFLRKIVGTENTGDGELDSPVDADDAAALMDDEPIAPLAAK